MRRALDPKDIEANVFACNLLMPPRMIRKLMEKRPGITASRMAKVFQVSEDIMTAWLVRVKL